MPENNNRPSVNTRFTFCKEEKLCSKKIIEELFGSSSVLKQYPLVMSYLPLRHPLPFPAQVLIIVPKKRFKKAHDRNKVRRQIREIYRLNKHKIYELLNRHTIHCAIGLSYVSNDIPSLSALQKIFNSLLLKLENELEKYPV